VYAVHENELRLLRSWGTGSGWVADTVAELPRTMQPSDGLNLASALTALSAAVWRTYTHPVSAADSHDLNSAGWRRQAEREAFGTVIDAPWKPNLPHGGTLLQSYVRVEEYAHRLGRTLHALDDPTLTDEVVGEVKNELAAVEQAERGELSGRARQAVLLTRADASPLMVNAADDLLRQDPLGSESLFQAVDPAAAAVAAAHWLQAAADVVAELADGDPTEVVIEAHDIEALPVATPTVVLRRLNAGETPREVVIDLIRVAMTAAEGRIADLRSMAGLIDGVSRTTEEVRRPGETDRLEERQPRITLLDPARPAPDLLEDLLAGVRGCWLLYQEYADSDFDGGVDDPIVEAGADEILDRLTTEFYDAVRAEADAERDRLS
jgi:hypothetical protein